MMFQRVYQGSILWTEHEHNCHSARVPDYSIHLGFAYYMLFFKYCTVVEDKVVCRISRRLGSKIDEQI